MQCSAAPTTCPLFKGAKTPMSQKQTVAVIVAIFVGLMMTALFLNQTSSPTIEEQHMEIEKAINAYLEKEQFALPETWSQDIANTYLQNCLVLANEKSGKELNSVRVNESIDGDAINVFFIDDDPDHLFTAFRGNCVSIGYKNIILCDLPFVKRLQTPVLTDESTGTDAATSRLFREARIRQQTLAWLWVVGHEIGHIAHEHSGRHFHFAGDPNIELITDNRGGYSQQEREADDFAIEAVGTDALGRLMYQGIHQFVNSEGTRIAQTQGDQNWQQLDTISLRQSSTTHPPLFYRAARFNLAIINHFVADPQQLKLPGLEDYDGKIYLIESPEYYEGIMNKVRFEDDK